MNPRSIVCIGLISLLAFPSIGVAREAVFLDIGGGTIDLVPTGPIVVDGSRISLLVVVTDEDGNPASGVDFQGSAATVSHLDPSCEELTPGLYACDYGTPSWMPEDGGSVVLAAELRSGSRLEATFALEFVRETSDAIDATVSPSTLMLGQRSQAVVALEVVDGDGEPVGGLHLVARANVGEVLDITALGGGRYETTYYPPESEDPQVAVISIWEAGDPDRAHEFMAIPLVGRLEYPVKVRSAGVEMTFRIGKESFPPVTSDANGEASVMLTVPPGHRLASVDIVQPEGGKTTREMDLGLPAFNRIALGGVPEAVVADGKQSVRIRVFVLDEEGRPERFDPGIEFSVRTGTMGALEFMGDGEFRTTYTPPAIQEGRVVTISAILGEGPASVDAVELQLVPGGPNAVTLESDPEDISRGTREVLLIATLRDTKGRPATGPYDIEFHTSGEKVRDARIEGPGVFLADAPMEGDGPTWVQVVAGIEGSRRDIVHLIGLPVREAVPYGEQTALTVMALDHTGNPVRAAQIDARVIRGGGRIHGTAKTDAYGIASLEFTAGDVPGLGLVELEAGGRRSQVPILQVAEPLDFFFEFPAAGGQLSQPVLARWKDLSARLALGGPARVEGLKSLAPRGLVSVMGSSSDDRDDRDGGDDGGAGDGGDGGDDGGAGDGGDDGDDRDDGDEDAEASSADIETTTTERVRKAPGEAMGRKDHRSAQVYIGWAPGVYYYISTPCDEDEAGCLDASEPDELDFAGRTSNNNVLGSFAVGGEWFPFQEYAGFRVGYARLGFTPQTDSLDWSYACRDIPTCTALNFFNVEAQGRIPLLKKKGPLDVLVRFGYQFQDATILREDRSGDPDDPDFEAFETRIHGLTAGLGIRFTIIPQLRPHVGYNLGFAGLAQVAAGTFPVPGVTSHRVVGGLTVVVWKGLLLDARYDVTIRTLNVSMAGVDDETQRGQVYENLHTARISAGWAF